MHCPEINTKRKEIRNETHLVLGCSGSLRGDYYFINFRQNIRGDIKMDWGYYVVAGILILIVGVWIGYKVMKK